MTVTDSPKHILVNEDPPQEPPIKNDEEALKILKEIGFLNIEIKDLSSDVMKQIEEAFGYED